MKTITAQGKLPEEGLHRRECSKCHTVYTYEKSDMYIPMNAYWGRNAPVPYAVSCPYCYHEHRNTLTTPPTP